MKPEVNTRVFWDVNATELDYDKRSRFVIERVFERGDVCDVRNIRRYYGDELILKTLKSSNWLDEKTVYLASSIFRCPLNEFKCFLLNASTQEPWIY
jgi:hypothetical protein